MLNLCAGLENEFRAAAACVILCMHLCIAVLCVSVLQSTEAQCESISVIWGRSASQRGVVLYKRLQQSNVV